MESWHSLDDLRGQLEEFKCLLRRMAALIEELKWMMRPDGERNNPSKYTDAWVQDARYLSKRIDSIIDEIDKIINVE